MKSVKEVLNQYEEKPSADVWERLNARLDEEMPLTENVSRIHRVKAWKWVAAVLTVLVLGGGQDKIASREASVEIAEKLGCEYYIYEDLGHEAYSESKDFNRRIYDFFKKEN